MLASTLCRLERTAAEMDLTEQSSAEQLMRRLKADYDRLQARIEMMYMDRLDGPIDAAFFDAKTADWRREQKSLVSAGQE